ncbi:MAG TPA: DUF4234 domain-containing protein, partial [Clostridia bacterium]|nr:DUF4234 domain-containing protein [Clostridia bacterium]
MQVTPLQTNRSLGRFILLSIVTLGIYGIVYFYKVGRDLNTTCSPYDGKKTMHFVLLALLIAPLTAGIGGIVWIHKMSNRVG